MLLGIIRHEAKITQSPITAITKANHWLVNGNTKCFDVCLGWFAVSFLGEQVLHGTYGGSDGKTPLPGTGALTWLYVDQHLASVILLKSTAPSSTTPDGLSLELAVASHRILGSDVGLLKLLIKPLPPDQRLARVVFYNSITFPGDKIP